MTSPPSGRGPTGWPVSDWKQSYEAITSFSCLLVLLKAPAWMHSWAFVHTKEKCEMMSAFCTAAVKHGNRFCMLNKWAVVESVLGACWHGHSVHVWGRGQGAELMFPDPASSSSSKQSIVMRAQTLTPQSLTVRRRNPRFRQCPIISHSKGSRVYLTWEMNHRIERESYSWAAMEWFTYRVKWLANLEWALHAEAAGVSWKCTLPPVGE